MSETTQTLFAPHRNLDFFVHCSYTGSMTAEEKFDYWLDHATYDLESAEAMCAVGRWAYVVFRMRGDGC
jgi:hypothetical protein